MKSRAQGRVRELGNWPKITLRRLKQHSI